MTKRPRSFLDAPIEVFRKLGDPDCYIARFDCSASVWVRGKTRAGVVEALETFRATEQARRPPGGRSPRRRRRPPTRGATTMPPRMPAGDEAELLPRSTPPLLSAPPATELPEAVVALFKAMAEAPADRDFERQQAERAARSAPDTEPDAAPAPPARSAAA